MEWGYIVGTVGIVAAVGTAIVAWRKSGPESSQILVDAAKDVVLIQKDELDRLNATLNKIRDELAEANARAWKAEARVDELLRRVRHLETLQEQARERRIADIEERVTAEEARNTDIEGFAKRTTERIIRAEDKAAGHGQARPEEHEEKK